MVREIVHVQVGQCGNQVGNIFWRTTCGEHHIKPDGLFERNRVLDKSKFARFSELQAMANQGTRDPIMESKESNKNINESKDIDDDDDVKDPNPSSKPNNALSKYDKLLLDKIDVYFIEASSKNLRYTPRAVIVDLEPGTGDFIKQDLYGSIFKLDNFVMGASGCSNNWAKGRFTEGLEVIDEIMDIIRLESEQCECVQAFQMTHSLGGGTGSGLGTLILNKLRENYADKLTASFSVHPSPDESDVVVEPYNAVLAINELIECADQSFTIDNQALVRILSANKVATQAKEGFGQYNELISYAMSGITSSLRFPGQLNGDLRKMSVNLVPFPRLHFFTISHAPLLSEDQRMQFTALTTQELTASVLDHKSFFANLDPENGKFLSASVIYRGAKKDISTFEVDREIASIKYQSKYYGQFVSWIPNNFKYSLINVPCKGFDFQRGETIDIPMSATFVCNHTAIKDCFRKTVGKFKSLFKKKAFLHWYMEEGMEEENFEEASANLLDLIEEYQDKTNAVVHLDGYQTEYYPPVADELFEVDSEEEAAIMAKYSTKPVVSNTEEGDDGEESDLDDYF